MTKAEINTLRRLIECAEVLDKRPRPRCRDCADDGPTCPHSGLECDMRNLFADAKALHNKLAAPVEQEAEQQHTPTAVESAMMTLDADRARRLQERGPDRRVQSIAVPVERRQGQRRAS